MIRMPKPPMIVEDARAAYLDRLRDECAMAALTGELASYAGSCSDPANYAGDIAARCYKLADAMLAERKKRYD